MIWRGKRRGGKRRGGKRRGENRKCRGEGNWKTRRRGRRREEETNDKGWEEDVGGIEKRSRRVSRKP